MDKSLHTLYSISFVILTLLGGKLYSDHTEVMDKNKALSEAVKFALEKGIEPLAVTCAYDITHDPAPICVMYVSKTSRDDIIVPVTKK